MINDRGLRRLGGYVVLLAWSAVAPATAWGDELLQRPIPDDGGPTRVSVGFVLLDLLEISESEQTATVDFYIELSWEDPRLAEAAIAAARQWRFAPPQDVNGTPTAVEMTITVKFALDEEKDKQQ